MRTRGASAYQCGCCGIYRGRDKSRKKGGITSGQLGGCGLRTTYNERPISTGRANRVMGQEREIKIWAKDETNHCRTKLETMAKRQGISKGAYHIISYVISKKKLGPAAEGPSARRAFRPTLRWGQVAERPDRRRKAVKSVGRVP